MNLKKYIIIFAFLCLFSPSTGWAVTCDFYVKSGGNDTAAGTNDATAWANAPGMPGCTGSETCNTASVSNKIICLRSQDTWTVAGGECTLSAKAGATYDGSSYGTGTRAKLTRSSAQNSAVVQFIESNSTVQGFEIDGNNVGPHGVGINYINAHQNISDVKLDNCIIHNNSNIDDFHYGIAVGSYQGYSVTNAQILNTTVYNCAHECIVLYPDSGPVVNAIVRGCVVYGAGYGDPDKSHADDILVKNAVSGSIIEFNDLSGGDRGLTFETGYASATNTTIRYNVIRNNRSYGIWTLPGVYSANIYGNLFINNGTGGGSGMGIGFDNGNLGGSTFNIYNNTFYSSTNTSSTKAAVYVSASGTYTVNFKNNLVYTNVSGMTPVVDSGNRFTHSNNLLFNAQGSTSVHLNNGSNRDRTYVSQTWENWYGGTYPDPSFNNMANLPTGFSGIYGTDMAPNTTGLGVSSGPALDHGATIGNPYNGSINQAGLAIPLLRPQGSAYDIGADEFIAGDITPPAISNPLPSGSQTCTSNPRNITLQITTNENATCKYSTSDQAYDSMPNTFGTTGAMSHSQSVVLNCGAAYTYYARCMDGAGNKNTSSTAISFSIAAQGGTDPSGLRIVGGDVVGGGSK